jgi:hypothetical protein
MSFLTAAAVMGMAMAAPVQASEDAEPTSYAPRNECREDPEAAAFLDALAAAVDARDSARLVALAV